MKEKYVLKNLKTSDLNGNMIVVPNVKHYFYDEPFLWVFKRKEFAVSLDDLIKKLIVYHRREIRELEKSQWEKVKKC